MKIFKEYIHDESGEFNRGKVTRFLGHFDNKEDAIEFARKISRQQGTELIIHGKDGKIQSDRDN